MIRRFIGIAAVAIMMVSCNEQKTAYVDTTVLIKEYKEMKDVEADFTSKSDSVRSQLDSAAKAFQEEVQAYQSQMNSMSESQRKEKEQELMQKQQMLQQQQQMVGNRLREESNSVMDSVVTKIKDYVKDYGEENNYTYIFGSNESANIMYAEEGLDITQDILTELNEGYGGEEAESTEEEVAEEE
ncbi:OmpH family outer membrane protein [Christiangramia forsetii]|uniref:Outer membrane protein (OmpH-like) n=2 Tax=Christiangramia forsetii TaxID=411153 RepID=A0M6J5_CHRFK|nr:OmpH family outer membrane protein [Christiangramia forsetii]GGG30244.1 membrane protein [Christiangramia forsetii]CAL68240.1 outer membrane protein (OmpH-like) [Christiangramia forsetii KT0803]